MYIIGEDGPGALDHNNSKCITHVYIVLKEIFDKKNEFKKHEIYVYSNFKAAIEHLKEECKHFKVNADFNKKVMIYNSDDFDVTVKIEKIKLNDTCIYDRTFDKLTEEFKRLTDEFKENNKNREITVQFESKW